MNKNVMDDIFACMYQCTAVCRRPWIVSSSRILSSLFGPVSKCLPSLVVPAKLHGGTSFFSSLSVVWIDSIHFKDRCRVSNMWQTINQWKSWGHLTSSSAGSVRSRNTALPSGHKAERAAFWRFSSYTRDSRKRDVSNGGILALVSSPLKTMT